MTCTASTPLDHWHGTADGDIVDAALDVVASTPQHAGEFVIVARTRSGEHRAFGGQHSALRAAVSVAVAAGNDRFWHDAVDATPIEVDPRALPEVVATAAEAAGVRTAHIGCVRDDALDALAIWFDVSGEVANAEQRVHTMTKLSSAANRLRIQLADEATARAEAAASRPTSDNTSETELTLTSRHDFMDALDEYEADEVTLLLIDIDNFNEHTAAGEHAATQVGRHVASRLAESCRKDDLVACIADGCYAVLFADPTRAVGMQVAKRLCEAIAGSIDVGTETRDVTATVAVAHQYGLVDTEELLESADLAVTSGRRQGVGRLVIAS